MNSNESGHAAINHYVATGHPIVSERFFPESRENDYRVQQTLN